MNGREARMAEVANEEGSKLSFAEAMTRAKDCELDAALALHGNEARVEEARQALLATYEAQVDIKIAAVRRLRGLRAW